VIGIKLKKPCPMSRAGFLCLRPEKTGREYGCFFAAEENFGKELRENKHFKFVIPYAKRSKNFSLVL